MPPRGSGSRGERVTRPVGARPYYCREPRPLPLSAAGLVVNDDGAASPVDASTVDAPVVLRIDTPAPARATLARADASVVQP